MEEIPGSTAGEREGEAGSEGSPRVVTPWGSVLLGPAEGMCPRPPAAWSLGTSGPLGRPAQRPEQVPEKALRLRSRARRALEGKAVAHRPQACTCGRTEKDQRDAGRTSSLCSQLRQRLCPDSSLCLPPAQGSHFPSAPPSSLSPPLPRQWKPCIEPVLLSHHLDLDRAGLSHQPGPGAQGALTSEARIPEEQSITLA